MLLYLMISKELIDWQYFTLVLSCFVMLLKFVFGAEAAKTGIDIQEKLIELRWRESYRDGKSVVYRK